MKSGYYEQRSIQKIPKVSVTMYMAMCGQFYLDTDEHLNDAKDAIREAQKLEDGASDTNLEIRVANGYLLMKQGKTQAGKKGV